MSRLRVNTESLSNSSGAYSENIARNNPELGCILVASSIERELVCCSTHHIEFHRLNERASSVHCPVGKLLGDLQQATETISELEESSASADEIESMKHIGHTLIDQLNNSCTDIRDVGSELSIDTSYIAERVAESLKSFIEEQLDSSIGDESTELENKLDSIASDIESSISDAETEADQF